MISLFSFLHTGMVIVQFRGRLVRQYRACVIDSLGLGITCVLYHSSMCTRHPNLVSSAFYAIPIFHITQYGSTVYIGMAMGGSAL